ncbi:MAG: hypothetical protein IPM82_06365 [Saprospiraceae bacterium]|nr:hypothetical protein [Saprospiraceae bacterium]
MKNSNKIMSPKAFLEELKSIRLELQPSEISDATRADMLKTLSEMELLVKSLKQRLLKEETPTTSAKA